MKSALFLLLWCGPLLVLSQTYHQVQLSIAPDSIQPTGYGYSIAIHGNVALFGTPIEPRDHQGENSMWGAGAVYVWQRTAGGEWQFQQKLTPANRDTLDRFGHAISMHGAYAIIAAPDKRISPTEKGAAYIYKRDGQGNWQEVTMLSVPEAQFDDMVAESVDIHGRYALISAPGDNHDFGNQTGGLHNGAAYVFERDSLGESWTQVAKLWEPDSSNDNYAGRVLSIEGNYAALGAPTEAEDENGVNSHPGSGAVYLFERDSSGSWQFHQKLVDPLRNIAFGSYFGFNVDFDQGQLLIGARLHPNYDSLGILRAGGVFVFERDSNGVWSSRQRITPEDLHPQGHDFGYSLSARNGTMIIGAPGDAYQMGPFRGAVYFYQRLPDGSWEFLHKTYEPQGLAGPNNHFGSGSLAIDGSSAIAGTSGGRGGGHAFNYAYHYEQCLARHEVVKLTACEPMAYYGHWLDSTGLYENLSLEVDWDCDSLTADVQFDLIEVDTSVIRQGDSLIATASNATFQWIRCMPGWPEIPGGTEAVLLPDTAGLYSVIVDQQGCQRQSGCFWWAPALVSAEAPLISRLRLYPNPGSGQATLDLSALSQPADLRIYDARGRWLGRLERRHGSVEVDLRELGGGPGLYVIQVQAGGEIGTLKMVWE